jgi:hypothetical protein
MFIHLPIDLLIFPAGLFEFLLQIVDDEVSLFLKLPVLLGEFIELFAFGLVHDSVVGHRYYLGNDVNIN